MGPRLKESEVVTASSWDRMGNSKKVSDPIHLPFLSFMPDTVLHCGSKGKKSDALNDGWVASWAPGMARAPE